jgi:hypothetical protein
LVEYSATNTYISGHMVNSSSMFHFSPITWDSLSDLGTNTSRINAIMHIPEKCTCSLTTLHRMHRNSQAPTILLHAK